LNIKNRTSKIENRTSIKPSVRPARPTTEPTNQIKSLERQNKVYAKTPIEQLQRSTSTTAQMTTSSSTLTTDQMTTSTTDQITIPQGLQDDIPDTIEAIPAQPNSSPELLKLRADLPTDTPTLSLAFYCHPRQ
jgi:hypothetical protein